MGGVREVSKIRFEGPSPEIRMTVEARGFDPMVTAGAIAGGVLQERRAAFLTLLVGGVAAAVAYAAGALLKNVVA